ncbi:hypothetical protein FOXG_17256 [Fusarium oxysporum f. sp. lycopersici 4287]|uniref:Uncharacterized protein n=2 Tax=Fusarium oxysporum TaxID=5507 RepID=A0A0J9WBX7_FUSO4|nr:hypothetical protein FOXG_17256 [Fusarium oxysporum f. sp. lycopersici 4287]EWZ78901.1 hypothetical protein FOWG_16906 [Fusarium oxysporum f. sp. lycopersici MN25]KAJ9413707.1 hypothetical protein QL093DRAFT_2089968 [Fusarium oxysporum]KNB20006.1 hypothetical protein FOXG_17256 [Fusarium oxysporum f. sp. lycopersici 4287]
MSATRTRGLPTWLSAMQKRKVAITIAHRTFIIWSIHKDPFPEATTRLSRLGRHLLASVLLIIQLAFLVGVPAAMSFQAWSTQNQLWPALIDLGLGKEAGEVVVYLILDAILLTIIFWGAVPVMAQRRGHGDRVRVTANTAFVLMVTAIVGVSVRTMYLTWNWTLRSALAYDHTGLRARCKLIFFTAGILLCSGCASIAVFVFYAARSGTPSRKQIRMVDDTADGESKMKAVDAI